jgi:hypothetical protein
MVSTLVYLDENPKKGDLMMFGGIEYTEKVATGSDSEPMMFHDAATGMESTEICTPVMLTVPPAGHFNHLPLP